MDDPKKNSRWVFSAEEFGRQLFMARNTRQMTAVKFAALTGLDETTITGVKHSYRTRAFEHFTQPPVPVLEKIASVLGLELDRVKMWGMVEGKPPK